MKRMIRPLLAVCGICFFFWFLIPATKGIFNIGNLTGMALSVLLFCYGILQARFHRLVAAAWSYGVGKAVVLIVAGAALLIAGTALFISVRMIVANHTPPAKDATLVVLGCKVNGVTPSLSLQERIEAAHAYLTAHPDAAVVVSGGQGEGEDITEAACILHHLTARGIAPERIYPESRSTSTRENLEYSLQVIREHGLPDEIAVATNEYHMLRAMTIAKDLGTEAGAVPAATVWYLFPTYYVRELYGVLHEWIF